MTVERRLLTRATRTLTHAEKRASEPEPIIIFADKACQICPQVEVVRLGFGRALIRKP